MPAGRRDLASLGSAARITRRPSGVSCTSSSIERLASAWGTYRVLMRPRRARAFQVEPERFAQVRALALVQLLPDRQRLLSSGCGHRDSLLALSQERFGGAHSRGAPVRLTSITVP